MKKFFLFATLFAVCSSFAVAQKSNVDSLQKAYTKNKQDSTLVLLLIEKANTVFLTTNVDSGMLCSRQSLVLSLRIHFKRGEVRALTSIANYLNIAGDLPGSLKITFETLPKAKEINDTRSIMACYNSLGLVYSTLHDYQKSLDNYYTSKNIGEKMHVKDLLIVEYNNISRDYLDMNRLDSALFYTRKAYGFSLKNKMVTRIGYLIRNFGIIQFKKGSPKEAIDFYNKSIKNIPGGNDHYLLSEDYRRMAEAYQRKNKLDSCIYYAKQALEQAKLDKNPDQVMRAATLLTDVFKSKNDFKEAFGYQQIMLNARDSLFSQQKTLQVQNLNFEEEQRRQEIQAAQVAYRNRVRFYTLLGVVGVFILIAGILLFANQKRKKANELLHERNEQIETQSNALVKTLSELKTTQTQLIQSEKLASLGELTAGIAHEIQNPLNFVNNFAEVSVELVDELAEELQNKKRDAGAEEELLTDLKQNLEKITHHGKRADGIVKNMLQHSRANTGEREPTDINTLADEYLRIAYHGLRAKDKNFNSAMVTSLDSALPKIDAVPQDIGRVLLNLFNNAFYAVHLKQQTAGADYRPEVAVTTHEEKGGVVIKVRDNGNGIPDAIRDKIMQPFFTTKPTGEGTGLGLSLTYDIVVKGHGGSIDIDTKEREFSEFTITLPIN